MPLEIPVDDAHVQVQQLHELEHGVKAHLAVADVDHLPDVGRHQMGLRRGDRHGDLVVDAGAGQGAVVGDQIDVADADLIKGMYGFQSCLVGVVHQQHVGARRDGGDQVQRFPGRAAGDHDDLGEILHKILDLLENAALPDQIGVCRQRRPGIQAVEKGICESDVLVKDLFKALFQEVDDLLIFIVLVKDNGIFHVYSPRTGRNQHLQRQYSTNNWIKTRLNKI